MKQTSPYFLSNFQMIQGYQIQSFIGKGQFGQVFKALKFETREIVAIKLIQKKRFQESDGIVGKLVQSEIKALELVKSDHVVRFIESFQDQEYCYIVMEYCDSGDLDQHLNNLKMKLTENDAIGIIKQILKGLKDLHSKFIIHRDLKLQNIMVHNNSIYKIADLGFSKVFSNADQKSILQLGTLYTMAPEIFNQNQYGLSSDMFSVGVIFYQILFDRLPFKQRDYTSNSQPNISFQKNKFEVSAQTINLLEKMLQFNPNNRITFKDLMRHPVFASDKTFHSITSKIQLQANTISFDDYQEFYQQQSGQIEQNQSKIMQQQQPIQSIVQKDRLSQKSVQIIDISEIRNDIAENTLSLEIDKITKLINEMYFFSNTLQEVIQILCNPHFMDMLCFKIQKLCQSILKLIKENMNQYKNQKQYKDDYKLLEEQNREMESYNELIQYYLFDVKDQLAQFSEESLQDSISQFRDQDQQFNKGFSQQIKNYLDYKNQQINIAFAHVILCYLYCKTQNPDFIQFDQTTFNLNKSQELYPNQNQLLERFKENSSLSDYLQY
ncbi:unnamed protein product (macronuclear) [Paramecium tetraurelia]|uniref:Protein kinase domain-containing protein n=1 Tax=Paramecium tetraurelia TaxID=5888 RepID=A0BU91_PARTE|nr:uncharacterized protein GSPATT00032340001 [Paramecium tetraurelia]CAK62108.1 unnamed protein product [Paramecium tetraurelia]|eukprot:XP_001429506.1 hypothetical protein (macronuclear) [Paramecium tetraurelia strain d4-2]